MIDTARAAIETVLDCVENARKIARLSFDSICQLLSAAGVATEPDVLRAPINQIMVLQGSSVPRARSCPRSTAIASTPDQGLLRPVASPS